jgi:hypothetical protein
MPNTYTYTWNGVEYTRINDWIEIISPSQFHIETDMGITLIDDTMGEIYENLINS